MILLSASAYFCTLLCERVFSSSVDHVREYNNTNCREHCAYMLSRCSKVLNLSHIEISCTEWSCFEGITSRLEYNSLFCVKLQHQDFVGLFCLYMSSALMFSYVNFHHWGSLISLSIYLQCIVAQLTVLNLLLICFNLLVYSLLAFC